MLEDKILVWRFNHGRPEVLHHVYDKYRGELLTLALALLGDLAAAEDVVQDVFLSLVRLSGRLKLTGSLKGYLATSVANGARNVLRVHRRHPTGDLDEADPVQAPDARPDEAAVLAEQLDQLKWALGQIPYEQREVLVLRVYGQITFKEIARQQGIPINTALGRYRYAIDRLRSMLDGEVRK
ncbi:MAG: sigma-70 family RNA polymerase sigma factor [Planctomycetes bacterium]|nr:sigma-70 family RNA polymerase sigma factor [Planctomycetota bacterium]